MEMLKHEKNATRQECNMKKCNTKNKWEKAKHEKVQHEQKIKCERNSET